MQEIGTLEIGWHTTNLHIKKAYYYELKDRFQKNAIFGSHILKIADKKTACNKGCL
jgi:hypothetical protein